MRAWGWIATAVTTLAALACDRGTTLEGDADGTVADDAGIVDDGGGADGDGDADDAVPDDAADDGGGETVECLSAADCDDGIHCNGIEICVGGVCRPGARPDCDDGVECTEDSCIEDPPSCRSRPHDELCPEGWTCGPDGCTAACATSGDCVDDDPCNGAELCIDGRCVSGEPIVCDDGIVCTDDSCFDGLCVYLADHARCAAGELCDPTVGCVAAGACGTDVDCDDGDPCNGVERCAAGVCVPGTSLRCDDGDPCNGVERCVGGACVAGTPLRCDDGDDCNGVETCVAGVCVAGEPLRCDDGDPCNGVESCRGGRCVRGVPIDCDDGDECTIDRCDAATGRCSWMPADRDGDGFGNADCGGTDCDDEREWVHPGALESCVGGVDEDCDGRTDCDDEVCASLPECCVPAPETCDGEDEDCDTVADDGLSCYVVDGRDVVRPVTGAGCATTFYSYGRPTAGSANPDPDVTVSNAVVVMAYEGPAVCGSFDVVVIVDRAGDGSGGELLFEWVSDPRAVAGIVVGDDPADCRYNPDLGAGRCRWRWDACCTDGVVLGDYAGDFCTYLRFILGSGVGEVRVLDGAASWLPRGFDEVISLCRVTTPAVP